jgi:DNA (cytosine-5)-methyltransferase 1
VGARRPSGTKVVLRAVGQDSKKYLDCEGDTGKPWSPFCVRGEEAMKGWTVVDLFCGIGGLAHGFVKEGFHVAAGIDLDASCEYAFRENNRARFIHRNVELLTSSELAHIFGTSRRRILVGCAPCQPFSKYTSAQSEDHKWHLLKSFLRLVVQVRPEIISMENVAELQKHVIFHDFVDVLEEHGYEVTESVVETWRYGVPQTRKRLVLLGSRLGRICLPPPTHGESRRRTVRKVIGSLEEISAGETSSSDPLHRARALSSLNLKRIRNTPEGGDWRSWPASLRLACHKRASGKRYEAIYGRMSWNRLAPTLTTHCCGIGNGRFGHPEQDRGISLREAALLQTFPKYYELYDPAVRISSKLLSKHIGNAVPVRLGRIIARAIRQHVEVADGGSNER